MNGTTIIIPKNPYIMEGIPARRLTIGFAILYIIRGQNLAMNTAIKIPTGTPITNAPAVTIRLPTIIGSIPK